VILQQCDKILGLMSAGWTNERHSTFISSMEASFLDQLYGLENHMINAKRSHLGGNAIRFEGADVRMHDGVARSLPDNLLIRRFRPPNAGLNRSGDGAEDSVDDYGSGTDTVREKVRIHGRRAKGFAEGNFIGKRLLFCCISCKLFQADK
jgi:hypothetical protein